MRICFVALNALPVIDPTATGAIGGIETRSWLLARKLVELADTEVEFVVRSHRRPRNLSYSNVDLCVVVEPLMLVRRSVSHLVERLPNFPWLHIKRWAPGLLWKIPLLAVARMSRSVMRYRKATLERTLNSVAADVFCTFGVNRESALVVKVAHSMSRPVVLFLGSDLDVDAGILKGAEYVNQYGDPGHVSRMAIESADMIVAQTEHQRSMLRNRFGRDSELLKNPIDLDLWKCGPVSGSVSGEYVLWIGRADAGPKQPLLCLQMARELPEVQFIMVMNPFDAGVQKTVEESLPQNVRLLLRVPPNEMPQLYAKARLLLNTSSFEGFPNTFLQALSTCVPVCSLNVSADFFAEPGVGYCANGDFAALIRMTKQLWRSPPERATLRQGRDRIIPIHEARQQAVRLKEMLQRVVGSQ